MRLLCSWIDPAGWPVSKYMKSSSCQGQPTAIQAGLYNPSSQACSETTLQFHRIPLGPSCPLSCVYTTPFQLARILIFDMIIKGSTLATACLPTSICINHSLPISRTTHCDYGDDEWMVPCSSSASTAAGRQVHTQISAQLLTDWRHFTLWCWVDDVGRGSWKLISMGMPMIFHYAAFLRGWTSDGCKDRHHQKGIPTRPSLHPENLWFNKHTHAIHKCLLYVSSCPKCERNRFHPPP